MEELIRNIIQADKEARNAVQEQLILRNNIQKLIQEQNKTIKDKFLEETTHCIAEKHAALDAEFDLQEQQEQVELEKALQSLEMNYDQRKQDWVREIYHRCLSS